jgi:hypothetical protein
MEARPFVMSQHAAERARDRSIPDIAQWLLAEFGTRRRAGRGADSYSFDKKSWKDVERLFGSWPLKKMDQLKRTYMVVADDGTVITLAYRD